MADKLEDQFAEIKAILDQRDAAEAKAVKA